MKEYKIAILNVPTLLDQKLFGATTTKSVYTVQAKSYRAAVKAAQRAHDGTGADLECMMESGADLEDKLEALMEA